MDLTLGLAIYGAILSTVMAMLKVAEHLRERPRLIFRVKRLFHPLHGFLGGPTSTTIATEIVKKGKGPLTIAEVGLQLASGERLSLEDTALPRELGEGQLHKVTHTVEIQPDNAILFVFARDTTGRVHRSKKRPLHSKMP